MKELGKPGLGLIKQENQGCGRFSNVCVRFARGSMKVATNAGVFTADLLREQRRGWRFNEWLRAAPLAWCSAGPL